MSPLCSPALHLPPRHSPQNRLAALPPAVGALSSLASLKLADNRLGDGGLPWDALARLTGLTLLSLDRNALTALPAALGGCSGLVRLSAAANRIASVEAGALRGLDALRELDVSDNCLTALPDTISEIWGSGGWWGGTERAAQVSAQAPDMGGHCLT
jgi:Leucine-rich repeat (LRR) protein